MRRHFEYRWKRVSKFTKRDFFFFFLRMGLIADNFLQFSFSQWWCTLPCGSWGVQDCSGAIISSSYPLPEYKTFLCEGFKVHLFPILLHSCSKQSLKSNPNLRLYLWTEALTLNLIAKFVGAHKKWPRSFGFKILKWSSQCHVYKNKHTGTHAIMLLAVAAWQEQQTRTPRAQEKRRTGKCRFSTMPVKYLHFPDGFASTSCFPSVWVWLRAMNLCISF